MAQWLGRTRMLRQAREERVGDVCAGGGERFLVRGRDLRPETRAEGPRSGVSGACYLKAENATALLARAVHATRRQVEVLVAELAPQPDARSSLRRLPAPRPAASVAEVRSAAESLAAGGDVAADTALEVRPAGPVASPKRPRTGAAPGSTSRDVPAAVRRAVWQRDESRCTFVDRQGRRCEARDWLEIHHDDPFGRGGETRVENLRLLCRSHDQSQAEIDYGADFMQAKRGPP